MDQQPTEPMVVALDRGVVFERRDVGGLSTYVAQQHQTGKYFHFGAEEYHIAVMLDGHRSMTDLLSQLSDDGIGWTDEEVADFIGKLVASKLAAPVGTTSQPGQQPAASWMQRLPVYLSLVISQRIPLFNGHKLASRLNDRFGFVFSKVGILYWLALVASGLMVVGAHREQFYGELHRLFDPSVWLILILMWIFAKVIHELGHAVAARHHGVRVGKIGIMFFLCAPLAYVDVTDAWKLRSRWSRVQIAMAGIYLELAVAAIAAWAWWFLPDSYMKHLAAQMFLVAGPATLLVNANPLLRLDGYYVVSDLSEIPNLRMHGRKQLADVCNRLLLGKPIDRPLLVGWRRSFASIHAAASVVFQIVWMSGLVIGVSMWAQGLGLILASAAVLLWAVFPLTRWSVNVWFSKQGGRLFLNDTRIRLLCYVSLLVMAAQNLSMSDSPLARRVPVVVQFQSEQIARAPVDAFVDQVHVQRGQRVEPGMLLMELSDPELLLEREKKADEFQLAKLLTFQFQRQRQLSKAAAESENAASLQRQLAELDAQISGLSVVAQREGLVISPDLDSMLGRFVSKGDELLRVSDPQEKELLISVSESDMQAYQRAAELGKPAPIRLRGGTRLAAVPAALRPRARRTLPHPALAASAGGPLAVEPSPNRKEEMRLVEPQMESRAPLDPATSSTVMAGQIGTMTVADDRSFFDRLYKAMVPR